MTKLRLIVVPLVIVSFLAACSPSTQSSVAEEEATQDTLEATQDFPSPTEEPEIPPTETATLVPTQTAMPTETATVAPTPLPTATKEVAVISDACLGCHMDRDKLIATAKEEEKAPSESSGVG